MKLIKFGFVLCVSVMLLAFFYATYQFGYMRGALAADHICYCGRK